jgi:hypothetical protein
MPFPIRCPERCVKAPSRPCRYLHLPRPSRQVVATLPRLTNARVRWPSIDGDGARSKASLAGGDPDLSILKHHSLVPDKNLSKLDSATISRRRGLKTVSFAAISCSRLRIVLLALRVIDKGQ